MAARTASKKRETGPRHAPANPWLETWLNPETFEGLHVTAHTGDMQKSSIDHAEAVVQMTGKFVQDRLEKDFQTLRELAECRDYAGFVRINTDFWQTAWADYRDQLMRLGDETRMFMGDTEEVLLETSDDVTRTARRTMKAGS